MMIEETVEENPSDSNYEIDAPEITSSDWHDYAMKHFFPEELTEGNPTVDGLRRVGSLLCGPIIDQETSVVEGSNNDNSSVVVRITFLWSRPDSRSGLNVRFSGAANVSKENTEHPYCLHAVATAESKAESRALRKALMLRKIISAEEAIPVNKAVEEEKWEPSDKIDNAQIKVMNLLCDRLGISLMKFINAGKEKFNDIVDVPKAKAAQMIQTLNSYQLDNKNDESKKIPESVLK